MHSKAVFIIFNSDCLRQERQNCFIDVCNTDSPDKEDCPDFSSLFDSDSLNQRTRVFIHFHHRFSEHGTFDKVIFHSLRLLVVDNRLVTVMTCTACLMLGINVFCKQLPQAGHMATCTFLQCRTIIWLLRFRMVEVILVHAWHQCDNEIYFIFLLFFGFFQPVSQEPKNPNSRSFIGLG